MTVRAVDSIKSSDDNQKVMDSPKVTSWGARMIEVLREFSSALAELFRNANKEVNKEAKSLNGRVKEGSDDSLAWCCLGMQAGLMCGMLCVD